MPSRLPPPPAQPKQGSFPPAVSRRLPRYYEPLGLPPGSTRFRSAPYTRGLRPTQAAGEGLPCSTPFLRNVPSPIPRGRPVSPPVLSGHCLLPSPRHDRLGHPNHLSADNLTRLARCSLALRPASSLPPYEAFDGPLGHEALPSRLDPATGRSGAYPGGTLIRWNGAAFTAHHDAKIPPLGGEQQTCRRRRLRGRRQGRAS
jgi:hypothetical protein